MAASSQLLRNKNTKLVLSEMEENEKKNSIHTYNIPSLNKKESRSTGQKKILINLRNTSVNTERIGN